MSYRTILFDLDGTLTDPRSGITRSIEFALRKQGLTPPPASELEPLIGPPLERSFRELLGLDESQARRALEDYREYFGSRGIYENRVYRGIPELLARLHEEGRRIVLASSKPTVYAQRILDHFGLARWFDAVVGSFLDGRRVDKHELVAEALLCAQRVSRVPDAPGGPSSVMVGDRAHDVLGARANGIDSIAVSYGYGSAEELSGAGPTHHAESVEALSGVLGLQL